MKMKLLALATLTTLASTTVMAGSIPTYDLVTGAGSKTSTRGYVGLNWSLGGGATPAVVLGAMRAKVKSNGDLSGANLTFSLNVAGGVKPGKLKLGYLDGQTDLQGEIGAGYDFLASRPLLSLAANAPYLNAGVEFHQGGYTPNATLYSQGKLKTPQGTQCVAVVGGTYSDPTCTTPVLN